MGRLIVTNKHTGAQVSGSIRAIYAFFGFHRGAGILDGDDPDYTTVEPPRQNPAGGVFSVTKA